MNSHVEVICKEMIKPSSPTPQHLKTLKLSALDQLVPPIHIPVVFFYEADESSGLTTSNYVQVSQHMKKSLSQTLTCFYPLAGRIRQDSSVDCNDAGVEFIDARVRSRLMMDSVKEAADVEELKRYLPLDPVASGCPREGSAVCHVKASFFDCGGIAVGLCVVHQIADAASVVAFIKAWAETHRGEKPWKDGGMINFQLSRFFPAREFIGRETWRAPPPDVFTKRLVFDKEKLALLRKLAAISPHGSPTDAISDPTRVELVSAFILKHIKSVRPSQEMENSKAMAAMHAVNLRAKTGPNHDPILKNVFGNFIWAAIFFAAGTDDEVEEYHDFVREFRSAIKSIDSDIVTELQREDSHLLNAACSELKSGEIEWYVFSSWCGFPLYEVEFGWGKPIWVCTPGWPGKHGIVLLKGRNGQDIEAWVNDPDQHILDSLQAHIKNHNN